MRTSTVKSIAALALTGAGSALVIGFQTTPAEIKSAADSTGATSAGSGTGATSGAGSGTTATPAPGATADGGTTTSATYADGTWTGNAVREPWGPFQVQVVVSDGSIVNVVVVESPTDRRSTSINRQAVPILTESAMASQGVQVDAVSGATWTSESYATSFQSALDKAAAAA